MNTKPIILTVPAFEDFRGYKKQSNDVVSTECEIIKEQLKSGGTVEECAEILKIRANAFQKVNGSNYWKTCIYMAMSESQEQLAKLI